MLYLIYVLRSGCWEHCDTVASLAEARAIEKQLREFLSFEVRIRRAK